MSAGLFLALALAAPLQQEGLEEGALEIALQQEDPEPPLSEGALQNDVFLPFSAQAAQLLARGDASLARARELALAGARADAQRARTEAFESWFAALEAGGEEGSVPIDPEQPAAMTEGLWYALVRRLGGLEPADRALWRERFEPAAGAALEGALSQRTGLAGRLTAVERSFPGTRAAWIAALDATDLALEAGQDVRARALFERARALAALGDETSDAEPALRARAALLAPHEMPAAGAWETAGALVARGSLALRDPEQELADQRTLLAQHGVRPGLVWIDDRSLVVQTAGRVHRVDLIEGGPRLVLSFAPPELIGAQLGAQQSPFAGRQAPGWGLSPAATAGVGSAGARIVLTQGRAIPSEGEEEESEPNALLCAALEDGGARLCWAVSGAFRVGPDGERVAEPGLADLPGAEFQPAPRIAGSLVLAALRETGAEERAWLCAFELESGALVWRRFLAQGADLAPGGGRFGSGPGPRLAAPAPLVLGSRVFAATTLGAGVLLDLADGRPCWSLAIRRRSANDPGWSGTGPLALAGDPPGILWDPVDSDLLYRLRATPLDLGPARREGVFLEPPRRIGEAEDLVGGDALRTFVLAQPGPAARMLALWEAAGTDPLEALHLGPRERFRGAGLVGTNRVYACTERGVWLFDRERDLYLLQCAVLTRAADSQGLPGGDLFARGEHVVALGRDRLWAFRAR